MTPEQITAALGPDWEEFLCEWTHELGLVVGSDVENPEFPGWYVQRPGENYCTEWECPTPEAAVAVAHLLLAAERIATGAEVSTNRGETGEFLDAYATTTTTGGQIVIQAFSDECRSLTEERVRMLHAVILDGLTCGCPAPYDLCPHDDPTPMAEALAQAILNDHVTPIRLCGVDCATEREMAVENGRDEERAAVVAWLRTTRPLIMSVPRQADAIEKGEHRRG